MNGNPGSSEQIAALIRRLVSRIYSSSKAMTRRFGLTGPQVLALRTLLARGAKSSADLAQEMYVTPSNLTGIVDRLEVRGLLTRTRHEKDRRITLLRLTEEGEQLARTLPDAIEERLAEGIVNLKEEDVERIREALRLLVSIMERVEPLGIQHSEDPYTEANS
ncbi:MAG: MarR family transcriptional regulator [Candidatus Eisenbacteria bacterium]|nr:MarR family transcriptional regulator [Candidatus Eisenbacteria bacterium]